MNAIWNDRSAGKDKPVTITSTQRRPVQRLTRNRSALIGGSILFLFAIMAILGPALVKFDPILPSLVERLQPPSLQHWLGTDFLGRDMLSRIVYASRISLLVGIACGLASLVAGVPIGVVAGYAGGRTDELLMRAMDVLLAFPGILLAIGIIGILGPGLGSVMIAVAITTIPSYARIARALTLRTKTMLFVEAGRSLGTGTPRIIWLHILPNIVSPIIVLSSLRIASAILTASSLSFLGLGVQPPTPEWGAMLSDGRNYLRSAPYVTAIPGITIMLAVLGFNLLGDGIRDALDPRLMS